MRKDNGTGVRGVYILPSGRAQLVVSSKYCGSYDTVAEAELARAQILQKRWGGVPYQEAMGHGKD